jgi:hypothetical protein
MVSALPVHPMPLLLWHRQSACFILLLMMMMMMRLQRSMLVCSKRCVCSLHCCSPVADMDIRCISILQCGI